VLVDTSIVVERLPVAITAQLWKLRGPPAAALGVVFGVRRGTAGLAGCVMQFRSDGTARLARWPDRAHTADEWRASGAILAPESSSPDPRTGALAIREVRLTLDPDRVRATLDGTPIFTAAMPARCMRGSAGVYVGAGVTARVVYLFVERAG
jgi:hypothetical protein